MEGQQGVGGTAWCLVHHAALYFFLSEFCLASTLLGAVPHVDGLIGVLVAAGATRHRANVIEAFRCHLRQVTLR